MKAQLVVMGALALSGCASVGGPSPISRPDVVAQVNLLRQSAGLPPVRVAAFGVTRDRASSAWPHRNGDLAAGHKGFAGDVMAADVPGAWAGENLYRGPSRSSGQEVVETWSASVRHKAIMLHRGAHVCSAASVADERLAVVALTCGGDP
jgi:uncharacterized protein YkwD